MRTSILRPANVRKKSRRLGLETLENRHLLAAAPVISEFMASNDATLADGNGVFSDWIEIRNNGDEPVDLDGWFLTDDAGDHTKWTFPDDAQVNLAPGESLVVFASGDDLPDAAGNLHTNFKLRASGEYLGLFDSNETLVSEFGTDGSDYPAQTADVSYGLDAAGAVGYFLIPTPNAANGTSIPSLDSRNVVFSRDSGTFSSSFSLAIGSGVAGGTIVYTTDGSTPNSSSTVYTGPFTIADSVKITARVLQTGQPDGPVSSARYIELASNVQNVTSELPIVVLDNFGGGSVGDSFSDFSFQLFEPDAQTGETSLLSSPTVSTPSAIHVRGSSSSTFPKQQYRLELRDEAGDDLDFELAGLSADSDWVLFGPYVDKSLLRNPFNFEIGRQLGLNAPRTQFVELYLNSGGSNAPLSAADYVGVYSIRETIKIGEDRLDIEELTPADNAVPEITGGYLLRFDTGLDPGSLIYETGDNHRLQLVDQENYTAAQKSWLTSHVQEFVNILNGPDFADPVNGYAKYIDVDSFINLMVLNELGRDQDAYFRSNYLYKDRGGKITQGPLWDFNLTLGVGSSRGNTSASGWQYERNSAFVGAQWIGRLMEDPEFALKFRDRWFEARETVYDLDNISGILDGFVDELGDAPQRNFQRWNVLNSNLPFRPPNTATWIEQIDFMKQWISDRVDWIDSQLIDPAPPPILPSSAFVPNGGTVTLGSAAELEVVSLVSEARAFVPVDDSLETGAGPFWYETSFDASGWTTGSNGVGYENGQAEYDPLIGTDIQPAWDATESSVYTRFEFDLDASFDAADADSLELQIKADDGFAVYLNGQAIPSANRRAPADLNWQSNATSQLSDSTVANNYEFIDLSAHKQLLTPGSNVLAIHGLNLNDASSDLLIQPRLSLSTIVEANQNNVYYTVDGSDPRAPGGGIHGVLYPSGGFPITTNTTVKARTLVNGNWSPLSSKFFIVGQLGDPTQLRISEINYHPHDPSSSELQAISGLDDDDFEFIEIINPDPMGTLDLAGFSLAGDVSFSFDSVFLGPGERAVIVEDEAAFQIRYGTDALVLGQWSGRLPNSGGQVSITDADRNELLNVAYNDNDPWPLTADGIGATLVLSSPFNTPLNEAGAFHRWDASYEYGGTPGLSSSGKSVVINEVLSHASPQELPNVELLNVTSSTVNLGGWYLSSDPNALFDLQIPANTLLGPGEYILFPSSGLNLDPDGQNEVLLTQQVSTGEPRFLDSVEFGAALAGESFGRVPDGSGRVYPQATTTPGAANSAPRISPLIISEVSYHPSEPNATALQIDPTITDDELEFIEIHNPNVGSVSLDDWRLRGGSDFDFADGTSLAPQESLVVVRFDPGIDTNKAQAFRVHYGIGPSVSLVGPSGSSLNNNTDRVELQRAHQPSLGSAAGVAHITEDEVIFDDQAPWPSTADGQGDSLHRVSSGSYGNDASSWIAVEPTPGAAAAPPITPGDYNRDGFVTTLDHATWASSFNSTTALNADGNGNGIVDAADFTVWRDRLTFQAQVTSLSVPRAAPKAIVVGTKAGTNVGRLAPSSALPSILTTDDFGTPRSAMLPVDTIEIQVTDDSPEAVLYFDFPAYPKVSAVARTTLSVAPDRFDADEERKNENESDAYWLRRMREFEVMRFDQNESS